MEYRLRCSVWLSIKSHGYPAGNFSSKENFWSLSVNQLSLQKCKLATINLSNLSKWRSKTTWNNWCKVMKILMRVFQVPRNKNCRSSGESFSMATVSLLIVPLIMLAFFSWSITIRDSTESSMTSRVMTQGRVCPIRWQRSALCHSAAWFHQLQEVS